MYREIVKMWVEFDVTNSKKLQAYLNNFCVLFAYNSGVIENEKITYHDTREIFENGSVISYTGNLKTLFEIQNMKDAYHKMCKWFDERLPITQEHIKEMHYELTKATYDERRWELGERPGEYKRNDIWGVGKNEIAAPIENIETEMEEDIEQLFPVKPQNVLKATAWWHMRFEGIHAFADGNGRVGRAMMNYYLILNNHPPIIIYNEDKRRYYDALDCFDETGEIDLMVDFLEEQCVKTWSATYSRAKKKKGNNNR